MTDSRGGDENQLRRRHLGKSESVVFLLLLLLLLLLNEQSRLVGSIIFSDLNKFPLKLDASITLHQSLVFSCTANEQVKRHTLVI